MTAAEDNIRVLNDMLAAYNAHDADGTASFYAEDAVLEVEGVSPPVTGRQALADTFRSRFSGEVPDIHGRVLDAVADGEHVFSWLEYSGTPKGGLSAGLEGVSVPSSGRPFTNRLLDRMTIRDGKIAHEYAVINFQALLQQLASAEPSVNRSEELLRKYFDYVNRRDWDGIGSVFHPDYIFHVGDGTTLEGPDGVVAAFKALVAAFPDLRFEATDVHESAGGIAVCEYTGHLGVQRETWRSIVPTGQPVTLKACAVLGIRDGKIVSERSYWDPGLMLQAYGITYGG